MEEQEQVETIPKQVHLKRLQDKQSRISQLEDALAASQGQVKDLEGKLADIPDVGRLQKRLDRLEGERDQALKNLEDFRAQSADREALLAAGVTDSEDQELVRWRWERQGEDRPGLADWLADGAKKDRHLSYLWDPTAADQKAPEPDDNGTPVGRQRPPKTSTGVKPNGTPPPGAMSMEAILNMPASERVKPENREKIMAALKGG